MTYHNSKELLAEIKKFMDIDNIQVKDLAIRLKKSPQSVSQYFKNGNPNCSTLIEICDALGLQINISKRESSEEIR